MNIKITDLNSSWNQAWHRFAGIRLSWEDTRQDYYVQVYSRMAGKTPYNPERGPIGGWLYRIAVSTILNRYRATTVAKRGADVVVSGEAYDIGVLQVATEDETAEEAAIRLEELSCLKEAMAGLTEVQQKELMSIYWKGQPHRKALFRQYQDSLTELRQKLTR